MTALNSALVLIIEDEPAQLELLTYNLEAGGFRVAKACDGEEGRLLAEELQPDLILLDWMLPKLSGLEVCRHLKNTRDTRHIPIIMLTARGEEDDRVRGLDIGADDYVTKPYSINELVARVRAMLRRTRPGSVGQKLTYKDVTLDVEAHKVNRADTAIQLGPIEFRLLSTFMERPGRVWSRDDLLDRVWGRDKDVDPRTVDVHIGRLRKSLSIKGATDIIRTVRSVGYALE